MKYIKILNQIYEVSIESNSMTDCKNCTAHGENKNCKITGIVIDTDKITTCNFMNKSTVLKPITNKKELIKEAISNKIENINFINLYTGSIETEISMKVKLGN